MGGLNVLQSEFEVAALQFAQHTKEKGNESGFTQRGNSVHDVQKAIKGCSALYEDTKPDSKALKWLRQLSEKMVFYERVVDVLIQQHPETASLIWGGMKFLFLVRWAYA